MEFPPSPASYVWDIAKTYTTRSEVCPCDRYHTVEIYDRKVRTMSEHHVTVSGLVRKDGPSTSDGFGGKRFSPKKCPHDIDDHVVVKMTSDQWTHVVAKSSYFIVVHAQMIEGCLDTTCGGAGILASSCARAKSSNDSALTSFELFSGGFSGWTHVIRRLQELGYKFHHRISLDYDLDCSEMYCKSHGFRHVIGPQDFDWGNEAIPDNLFVVSDICDYGWCHLLADESFDLATESPPCPAWSLATACPGLLRSEGRLSVHCLGLINLVRPRAFVLEMVASMKSHEHWPLIRQFVQWMRFTIRSSATLNLSEIFPQHRERLILICTKDDFEHSPHRCLPWPAVQRQTMETFMNLMSLSSPWLEDTVIRPEVLAMYMDPGMIPKSVQSRKASAKKTRRDVEAYRLKYPQSVFGCILANYSYGHLLPEHSLRNFGLFGSILALPEGLRFMSLPEVVIAQGGLVDMWLPKDHRKAMRMLGNCIATPHALVGIVNTMCFLRDDIIGVEGQELMITALAGRFTAFNLRFQPSMDGWHLTKDDESCLPTLQMHATYKVTLRSPMDARCFFAEREVLLTEAIALLTGDSMPGELSFLPGGILEHKVALPNLMDVSDEPIFLFANVPSALRISKDRFSTLENQGKCICVLTKRGIFLLRRDQGMTIQDVVTVISHHCDIACTHLVGCFRERHMMQTLCPDAVVGRDIESACDDVRVLDYISISVNDHDFSFRASHDALKEFSELLVSTGLDETMQAFGWMFVVNAMDILDTQVNTIHLMQKPGCFSITHDEMSFCIALHLFLLRIKSWETLGRDPTVRCRIKLWHAWIWDSMVDKAIRMERFNEEWNKIAKLFGISRPWRYVINNRTINPEWPLGGFFENMDDGSEVLTVHMLLGVKGGGPVKLRSAEQLADDGNLSNLAEFEAQNFGPALSFVLQKVVDANKARQAYDISTFLELQASFREGFFVINGDYSLLQKFLQLMKDSSIEKVLDYCGWVVVCRFVQILDPTIASIMFVKKPLASAVSMEFLRAMLRSSLIFLGLPAAVVRSDNTVFTKVKLWNVVIFHDFWDRNQPLQDLIDAWDQASSILNDIIPVRLVGPGGNMNQDFPLRYFTKCSADGMTIATINYVVGLRGGGPADGIAPNEQKDAVKQRNSLASFLLAEGTDLKECTRFVDSLIKSAGPSAFAMVLSQKPASKKWEGLLHLANTMHVKPPDVTSRRQKMQKKMLGKFAGPNRISEEDIRVDALALQPGCVRNADGTECLQATKVSPNSSGIVMMRYSEAKPWIVAQEVISQDELVVAVVGPCGENSESCQKAQIPVMHGDDPLIIQVCLHNLGAKMVTLQYDEHDMIPEMESQVICLTAYKEEIETEVWSKLIRSPVRMMSQLLFGDQNDVSFLTPPWGRSFQLDGKRTDPDHASTVQFHGRIAKEHLRRVLRSSGTAGIYITPKGEDRKISGDFRIVWLQQSPVDLMISVSKCSNHLGIVRSARGSLHNRGIRFEKNDFAGAFTLLRPDDSLPNLVAANFHFKVQPVPVGSTAEQVQAWITARGWNAKPVKALTGNAWLCASETRFPETFAQWNNKSVLIKWIEPKENRAPIVLAGEMVKKPRNLSMPLGGADLQSNADDPWKNWIANQGGTGLQSSSHAKAPVSNLPGPLNGRKIEAPIEDRFSKHSAEIQDMRDKTDREITAMKENMQKLEKSIHDHGVQLQANNDQCKHEFATIRAETQSQLGNMANMFHDSLQKALAGHDKQMSSQFDEIKLLLSAKSTSSPVPKRAKQNARDSDDSSL